jgi:hypothetical protein
MLMASHAKPCQAMPSLAGRFLVKPSHAGQAKPCRPSQVNSFSSQAMPAKPSQAKSILFQVMPS